MNSYKYIIVEDSKFKRTVTLNRAELHNAFNEEFIEELTSVAKEVNSLDKRLFVLKSNGKSFCAGADLNWMKKMKSYTYEENVEDSKKLSEMFQAINDIQIPVIAKVKGYSLGGGTGLIAVCDYVLCEDKSIFGFTEVKLGLIPAVISPFVIKKIGESHARAFFLSGKRFSAQKALHMGLVHEVVTNENLDECFSQVEESFLNAAPLAVKSAKKLVLEIQAHVNIHEHCISQISKLRIADEGQVGMEKILNKQKHNWKEWKK